MDQLKDVILSTLAEIQETPQVNNVEQKQVEQEKDEIYNDNVENKEEDQSFDQTDELLFLESLRERFLVLFEGFQAPNNAALEAKIDLTLNFMEYVLSTLDNRIEQIKGK